MVTALMLLLCSNLFALEGVVTVLEAPVFHEANEASQVMQWRRKGEEIYIHEIHNRNNPGKPDFIETTNIHNTNELQEIDRFIELKESESEFFKTLDRTGHEAYMLKKHVKVIYQDRREKQGPIETFKPDNTDYRLAEPLPKNYPFKGDKEYRTFFQFGAGLPTTQTYEYSVDPSKTTSQPSLQFSIYGMKRAQVAGNERLFIGGILQVGYAYVTNEIGNIESTQALVDFGVGPAISYDVFIGEKNTLTLSAAISINIIDSQQVELEGESLNFRTISLSPIFSAQYHIKNIISDLDFVFGPQVKIGLPVTLSNQSSETVANSPFWDNTNEINRDLRTELSLLMGINRTF